jgi:uncharacterized protein
MLLLIEDKQRRLEELCRKHYVKRLELFGSATGNSFNPQNSDFDFLVVFEPSTPAEHAKRYFSLLSALRELLNRKVDLVEYMAIRNPYFKKSVDLSKVTIYGS